MKFIMIAMIIGCVSIAYGTESQSQKIYITTDADTISSFQGFMPMAAHFVARNQDVAIFETRQSNVVGISQMMHEEHKRCGGFMVHYTLEDAIMAAKTAKSSGGKKTEVRHNYSIDQQERVAHYLPVASEAGVRAVITKLSSFKNRYFQSEYGVASSRWIASYWRELSAHRNDVKVELVKHARWAQESIVMTITGSESPDEIVVIGGHADSINGRSVETIAPGADDNASGIGSISEVIRVAMKVGYKPKKTVMFMGYAAEEVGLLGSAEIANNFKKNKKTVVGVMQLDMTGHHGTSDKDIVMMSDYTNKDQNAFLGALIDKYLGLAWGYSRCGYGCSDHASWHKAGYAASIPFESTMGDINHKIHSTEDTLANIGGDATHALKFTKLALAYMVELAK